MTSRIPATAICLALLLARAPAEHRLADAAMTGDRAQVSLLLKQRANVNAAQGDGMTALHWAAFRDDLDMLVRLLQHGARVDACAHEGAITPLFFASSNGDPALVEALLKFGADANTTNANGTTVLMQAASAGNPEVAKILLQHGARVNDREAAHGQTALMFAAAANRAEVVRLLVQHGADPGMTTSVRETEKVRLDQDGHVMYQPPEDKTSGAKKGAASPETAEQLLKNAEQAEKAELEGLGRSLGFRSAQFLAGKAHPRPAPPAFRRVGPQFVGGMAALHYAAREGHKEAAQALVEAGADINQLNADKFSPLLLAIINGHLDLAMYLLGHGADPNLATLSGLTALYATIDVQWAPHASYPQPSIEQEQTSYLELAKALLDHGADVNARLGEKLWFRSLFSDSTWVDPTGATALWRAAQSSDTAAIRLLVAHGADPKLPTKGGDTPLMVAAGVGWAANWSVNAPVPALDAVKYLLESGNDVNAVDSRGYTPLHGAAYIGNNDMVTYLVSKGAKVDARSKAGDSPADMANGPTRFGQPHPDTVALLEKLGSPNSHNCRSDQCVVAPKAEKPLSPAERIDKDMLDKLAIALGFQSAAYLADAPAPKTPSGTAK
jgi:ankyrin repeat protein